jgi:hypothetical protein
MRKFFGSIGGVTRLTVQSDALKKNMLGDLSARLVDVYVPAGHGGQVLPLLVDLVGFTESGLSHTNWVGFRENLPEWLDRLISEERCRLSPSASPIASPGSAANQYINSASTGARETSCCKRWCRQSSSALGVAVTRAAACLARALAGTAPSRTRFATPTSRWPRPAIPAIWASSSAICPTCQPSYGPLPSGELDRDGSVLS